MRTSLAVAFISVTALTSFTALPAQRGMRVQQLGEGLHMLRGRGGNLAVSIGKDGTFLIDDQFAPMAPIIKRTIKRLGGDKVRFLINTHFHGDHVGGNENFGKTGSVIVAHANVRKRMSVEAFVNGQKKPAARPAALPVVTFTKDVTFHWNGDEVHVFHVPPAHTDGDSVVHWKKANVIHCGDIYFQGQYPFVDVDHGGRARGLVDACDKILTLANDETKIVPGHGRLSNKKELKEYRDMIDGVIKKVDAMIAKGMSVDDVVKAKPTKDLDETWGIGFMKPDRWVRLIARSVEQDRKAPKAKAKPGESKKSPK